MQIEITKKSITSAGEQFNNKLFNVVMTLKCWADGVDKATTPIIDQDISERYKVIGTEAENFATVEAKVKEKMKVIINNYNNEKSLLDCDSIDSTVVNLKTDLTK